MGGSLIQVMGKEEERRSPCFRVHQPGFESLLFLLLTNDLGKTLHFLSFRLFICKMGIMIFAFGVFGGD